MKMLPLGVAAAVTLLCSTAHAVPITYDLHWDFFVTHSSADDPAFEGLSNANASLSGSITLDTEGYDKLFTAGVVYPEYNAEFQQDVRAYKAASLQFSASLGSISWSLDELHDMHYLTSEPFKIHVVGDPLAPTAITFLVYDTTTDSTLRWGRSFCCNNGEVSFGPFASYYSYESLGSYYTPGEPGQSVRVVDVPEPGSLALFALGLGACGFAARRRAASLR
jgi:hypothetical protein